MKKYFQILQPCIKPYQYHATQSAPRIFFANYGYSNNTKGCPVVLMFKRTIFSSNCSSLCGQKYQAYVCGVVRPKVSVSINSGDDTFPFVW